MSDDDSRNTDTLFDSPMRKLDLKTCHVFHLPAVETMEDDGWRCCHCGLVWKKRNQTKMVYHLAQLQGGFVGTCTRSLSFPSDEELEAYSYRAKALLAGRNSRAHRVVALDNHVTDRHSAVLRAVEAKREVSRVDLFKGSVPRASPSESITSYVTGTSASVSNTRRALSSSDEPDSWSAFANAGFTSQSSGTKPKSSAPSQFISSDAQKKHDEATTHLAAMWVHCTGQDFSVFEDMIWKQFVEHLRTTSPKYKLPSRKRMSTDLLDTNYEVYMSSIMKKLMHGVEVGGISFPAMAPP